VGQEPRKTVEADLMQLIQNTIAKTSWEEMGGQGSLQYFPIEKTLVVTQCQEIQEEVQLLLATIRKLQDLMVNVEVRFVHASAETSQRLLRGMGQTGATVEARTMPETPATRSFINRPGSDLPGNPLQTPNGSPRFVAMDQAATQRFFASAQAQTTAIVPAPKINVYNGQRLAMNCLRKQTEVTEFRVPINEPAVVAVGTERRDEKATLVSHKEKTTSGCRYEVQPMVSADRKSVRLNLSFEHFVNEDAIERITKAAATFTVPDQRTLVWHLGATAGQQHLFVLVTPRVIVREEEEAIFLGNIAPIPGR
jgi:hypothetical protein